MPTIIEYLESALNAEQLEAATTTEGPLLVIAGPGSGKTKALVSRIAYLIHTGRARPWEVFAVTFTNKAAGEMRDRLERLIGPGVRDAWIGTFHALAARMLRIEGHRIGIGERFTIYDEEDALRLVKRTMDELAAEVGRWTVSPGEVAETIDRAKNRGLDALTYLAETEGASDATTRAVRAVFPVYQRALATANALDFGDLLLRAVELLSDPEARARFARPDGFRYVLVDEGQDTNPAQHRIVDLLASEHRNVCVVSDDDQSIYAFRGADPRYILDFPHRYPGARVVKLEQNYRSTANIIDAANAVISRNTHRFPKRLLTTTPGGAPVVAQTVLRGEDEAELVVRAIRERLDRGARPQDFAILVDSSATRPIPGKGFVLRYHDAGK
jgi:DNA helicase-2/ATP-dependent DNA helicase PcrA